MNAVTYRPRIKTLAIAHYYGILGAEAMPSRALEELILEYAEVKAKLHNASLGVFDDPIGYVPPRNTD